MPNLLVAIEILPFHTVEWVKDASVPDGRRLLVSGFVDNVGRYLARALNFT